MSAGYPLPAIQPDRLLLADLAGGRQGHFLIDEHLLREEMARFLSDQ